MLKNSKFLKPEYRYRSLSKAGLCLFATLMASGCYTNGNLFSGTSNPLTPVNGELKLPRQYAELEGTNGVARQIYDAMTLADAKRFNEARHLLKNARHVQEPDSEAYQAITCAMALLALRNGDIKTFKRLARQLDRSLDFPVSTPNAYTDVIALNRILDGREPPVNARPGINRLFQRYGHLLRTQPHKTRT